MSYKVVPDGLLEQGDIIRHVTLFRKSSLSEGDLPESYRSPVFVLSNGCDIEKKINVDLRTDTVLVASVFTLNSLPKSLHKDIAKHRVWNTSYLPKDEPIPEDCFVDWRSVQPVDKTTLLTARASDAYLCTIEGDLLGEISEQFWDFFFRPRPFNSALQIEATLDNF